MRAADVLCVGDLDVDLFVAVPRLPGLDEKLAGRRIGLLPGGMAANAAMALARLGHAARLAAAVGDDAEGARALQGLDAAGVDTRFVVRRAGTQTFTCLVLTLEGAPAAKALRFANVAAALSTLAVGGQDAMPSRAAVEARLASSMTEPAMADGPTRRFEHVSELEDQGLAPPDAVTMESLRLIVDEGLLGASRHVALGLEMLAHILRAAPPAEALRRAEAAAAFVARTRGQDTPVIGNSLSALLAGLSALPEGERADTLAHRIARFTEEAAARRACLVDAAARHLAGRRSLLAFYSSTVAAIVLRLAEADPPPEVVVLESRAIDGGEKYLRKFAAAGIALRFLPDAAMGWGLARCDAVLLGVETLRADDGGFLNTVGSTMLARLARERGIEVHAATELVKLDRRNYAGHRPSPALRRYDRLVPADLSAADIDTTAPELEVVPPSLTTAFLTEFCPVPPTAIWGLGREVFGPPEEPEQ